MHNIPKILYKYRDWKNENHKKILYEQNIFLPSVSSFNDPFEGNIPIEYEEDELKPERIFIKMRALAIEQYTNLSEQEIQKITYANQQKDLINDPKHIEEYNEDVKNSIEKSYGIFCLTTEGNNFLMWSHYSNSHKGFCIGFNTKILIETLKCGIGKVIYQEQIPKFRFNESIEDFVIKLLGTKGIVWNYENEYRIIKSLSANKSFTLPKEAISEIVLGCNMDLKTKFEIIEFIKLNLNHCRVYEIKKSNRLFKLEKNIIF